MKEHDPITEFEARVALARIGEGGGYVGSRFDRGWLFAPVGPSHIHSSQPPWVVYDNYEIVKANSPNRKTQLD